MVLHLEDINKVVLEENAIKLFWSIILKLKLRFTILGRFGRLIRVNPENPWSVYLLTWNFLLPVLKKSALWLAAAIPALMLASSVWAPIFLGVAK